MVEKGKNNGVIVEFDHDTTRAYVGLARVKCLIHHEGKINGRTFRKIKSSTPVVVKNKDVVVYVFPDGRVEISKHEQ